MSDAPDALPLPLAGEGRGEGTARRAVRLRRLASGRLVGLLPIAALLLLWQAAVLARVYPPVLLPSPAKVVEAFARFGPVIAGNALASVIRVAVGIGLAFAVAVPAGLLIGRYTALDRLTDWSIQTFRSVPPISLIPMAMLFFGIGDTPGHRADLPVRTVAAAAQHHLRRARHRAHAAEGRHRGRRVASCWSCATSSGPRRCPPCSPGCAWRSAAAG